MGAADQATLGSRVADPPTPAAALFANPAGLTQFGHKTMDASLGVGYGGLKIDASQAAGYTESDEIFPLIPVFGVAVPLSDELYFGAGLYGSTGSVFDFAADPTAGVDDFFSETIVVEAPFALAYRVSENLSLGAELSVLFGQLRTHFTAGGIDFRYRINSPGVQGALGASWQASDALRFGLGVRAPGMIWMDGSMPVAGGGRQNVEVDLKMPAQVFFGVTYECSRRLSLSASARLTDSSSLGSSIIKYELTPQAKSSFVPDAQDEWKFALGAEYAWSDNTRLHFGAAHAAHIVGSSGVNPLVFDAEDHKLSFGIGRDFGAWTLDAMVGYALPAGRYVPPGTALVLPGNYYQRGGIAVVGFTLPL
jgi:long-subunit fatty acid transport protein